MVSIQDTNLIPFSKIIKSYIGLLITTLLTPVMWVVDFIKTSTSFAPCGEDVDTIKKIKQLVGNYAQIKASRGIGDYEKCMAMIEAGADRIGTSIGVRIEGDGS